MVGQVARTWEETPRNALGGMRRVGTIQSRSLVDLTGLGIDRNGCGYLKELFFHRGVCHGLT
jgi:hypothetical protein